jgi:peptide subunit release factor RF-3
MTQEFGCPISLSPARWSFARRIAGAHAGALRGQRQTVLVENRHGDTLVLFASAFALEWAQQDHPTVAFEELGHLADTAGQPA